MCQLSNIFDIENEFYKFCDPTRISKFLAQAKLYEMSLGLPGDFIELGVFKGASFCRFRKLGYLFHPDHARKFLGFDVFGKFPEADHPIDKAELERQFISDGDTSINKDELYELLSRQNLSNNVELIKGDIRTTLPDYFSDQNDTAISIINIDLDLYGPIKTALEILFPRVVRGGIIILDDYAAGFPGARLAVDEFLEKSNRKETVKKFPWTNTPCYLIKQ